MFSLMPWPVVNGPGYRKQRNENRAEQICALMSGRILVRVSVSSAAMELPVALADGRGRVHLFCYCSGMAPPRRGSWR